MSAAAAAVGRSALLGLATGSRSFTGLALQVAATPGHAWRQPERTLGLLPVKGLAGLAALGEVVGDKLPSAPSRLLPPVLVPRLLLAAATAVLVARAEDERARVVAEPAAVHQGPAEASRPPEAAARVVPPSTFLAVPVAVAASLTSAVLGYLARSRASRASGRDWPGALVEDAVALTLAVVATRS